ncbi:hypothetical protein acsn021_22530 [Anaerocolumna cellulosilytica]|uniref:Uncharacterized protein n=1 Tax=Anaerocolumna cellulosilytica TaxID=433286 RepID=A0A6S6QVR6_9FIRM|nr:hemolysin activation protein [Anaerocolumna cellulosilytica]MBB5194100.1 hypothetical protein [Anaerocolumna cellulosilytica]BCJ94684.1 hypothetical protein acsn021_22530 [Anaerocolumna cellulosilytica]
MKPYLVDVPVLLFVFIRPDTLTKVFNEIKKARPRILILASDGPRDNHPEDMEKILKSREIVNEVDWDCKVYKLYFENNQGLYVMVQKALDFTFYYTDRCIFLEDDVVPSQSFFPFCAELLEKYKDDLRINMICGMNHLGIYKEPEADYFFTEAAAIWGFAMWKRTYLGFYDACYGKSNYTMGRLKEKTRNRKPFYKNLREYCVNQTVNGHLGGPEFYLRFTGCSQNRLNIIPKKNLIKNIGFGEGATHSAGDLAKLPLSVQKVFNMKVYPLTFPLTHPDYVIGDAKYEQLQDKITANNHPLMLALRKAEGFFRRLYYDKSACFKVSAGKYLLKLLYYSIVTFQSSLELGSFLLHKYILVIKGHKKIPKK